MIPHQTIVSPISSVCLHTAQHTDTRTQYTAQHTDTRTYTAQHTDTRTYTAQHTDTHRHTRGHSHIRVEVVNPTTTQLNVTTLIQHSLKTSGIPSNTQRQQLS